MRGENSSAGLFFPHPPSYLTANVGFGQCRCVRSYVCTCVTAGRRGVLWCPLPGLGVPLFIREAGKLMARMRQASGQATQMLLGHGPVVLVRGWLTARGGLTALLRLTVMLPVPGLSEDFKMFKTFVRKCCSFSS